MHVVSVTVCQRGREMRYRDRSLLVRRSGKKCDEYDDYNDLNFENVLLVYF